MTSRVRVRAFALSIAERAVGLFLGPVVALEGDRVRRILVAATGGMGDLVRIMPAVISLQRNFPEAEISLLAAPGASAVLGVFGTRPIFKKILTYDARGTHRSVFAKMRLVAELRGRRYDLIYSPDRGVGMREDCLMRALTGARHRLGFSRGKVGLLNTLHVPLDSHRSITQQNLDILRAAGLSACESGCTVSVAKKDIDKVRSQLHQEHIDSWERLVVVHPGASWEGSYRAWPMANYARLIRMMVEESRAHVVIVGTDAERDNADTLAKLCNDPKVLSLAGRTTLGELVALISLSDLFLGNDSGPLNVAAMMGANFVGLFGPTDPQQVLVQQETGSAVSLRLPCQPCYLHHEVFAPPCRQAERPPCMIDLPVPDVFSAVRRALRQ